MRWVARIALMGAVLALGGLPGVDRFHGAPAAAAEARANDRADRGPSRSDRISKGASSRDTDKASERAKRSGGRPGKSSEGRGKGARGDRAGGGAISPDSYAADPADEPAPAPADPDPDAEPTVPVRVDDPVPAPADPEPDAEPNVPVRVDDPIPAPAEPEPEPDPAEPTVPVDDPAPAPADPDPAEPTVPVRVDDPIPAPADPDPAEPTVPVRVDDPVPAPGEPDPEPIAPAPDGGVVAATPSAPVMSSDRGGSSDDDRRIQARLDKLLGRDRRARGAAGAETPEVEAPAAVAEVPVEPARAAQAAAVTAEAARAPRIALSSGGGGSTYRQHEISVLGLTPRARQVIGALGFRILSERRSPLLGNRVVAKLRTPSDQTAEVAIERVRKVLPELTFEFAHLYRPTGDAVPVRYPAEMVGAPAPGACRIDSRIGLIDSGVGKHASLARADITRRNFVGADAATNSAHGTAIASILVGDLPGSGPLAPGARVYSANVFAQDKDGLRADAHAIIAALDWMAAQRVPVVNLSLMGPPDALLAEAVRAAAERGQILVAAAGNDGPGAAPAYPAAYSAVIAVAALDARGRPYGRNNRGAYVYVSAPGVDVWGADARGGQAFWTGTSFAAPFVTAMLARDSAVGRARDINDARARIAASARDLGAPGRDPIYGYGLLQVGGCTGTAAPVLSSRD